MVRSTSATTFTYSGTKEFEDGAEVYAQYWTSERIGPHSQPVVSYFFPKGVGEYHYGDTHPMKPHRLTLTNSLVMGYKLDKLIDQVHNPRAATRQELEAYHDPRYLNILESRTRSSQQPLSSPTTRRGQDSISANYFNPFESDIFTDDCPVFGGMYDFFKQYAGGSLSGARSLAQGQSDIAINWSGGLHHAKKAEPSGFCYINDIVLAILELLRYHPRVLYIDIDIHHGDGVEQAFYHSNRVFTVSFHKYNGAFFPGTGKLQDIGSGQGKYFCTNIPLADGIDDTAYLSVFRQVIDAIITTFKPSSIVLQCGADSLGNDKLGAFNLSIKAHGECVRFVKKFNLPLLVLGGGGYTIHNVARCWTYETAVLVGAEISNVLPIGPYLSYFQPDYLLHTQIVSKYENENSPATLRNMVASVLTKLRYLQGAPSVSMDELPPNLKEWLEKEASQEEEMENERVEGDNVRDMDQRAVDRHFPRNEYFGGDKDNKGEGVEDEEDAKTNRRIRGGARRGAGRKPRGRGRGAGRGGGTSGNAGDEGNDSDKSNSGPVIVAAPTKRGRGRGRGRGRATARRGNPSSSGESNAMSE